MRVYLPTDGTRKPAPSHLMHLCPAAHMAGQADLPAHWVTDANEPVQFTVDFIVGEAEVEDELGRYMVAHKLAKRTKLLLPST